MVYSLKKITDKKLINLLLKYDLSDLSNKTEYMVNKFTIANTINSKTIPKDDSDAIRKEVFMDNIQYDYYIFSKE
jgi:hypothetical protein